MPPEPPRRRDLLRAARAHGADPALRGGGRAPVPAGQSRRLPPPRDRRGGDDRRHHLGDARRGLPDRHLPHPRPRDRPRHRPRAGDGGALRPGRRHQRRARRLDAHLRRRAALHGRLRDRRRQPADRRRARPRLPVQGRRRGHRLHVRRRRLQHRQLRRDDEPGGAVDAAGPLPGREQPLRDGDVDRAALGPDRPLEEGRGLRDPGDADRRHGRGRGARGGRRGPGDGARGGTADADRGRHLPLPRPLRRRPRGLPGARGGRGVARERPDRELRPALRRGGRAGRARGRAGARRGRGGGARGGRVRRRLAGTGARHDVREPLRADRLPRRLVRGRRAQPGPAPRRARGGDAGAGPRAGRGRRRLRRGRGGGRAAEPGGRGRRPGRHRARGPGRRPGRRAEGEPASAREVDATEERED